MSSRTSVSARTLRRAEQLLERVPFLDGHNDLPWIIRSDANARGDVVAYDLRRNRRGRESDIPKLKTGRVSAQFWAAFVPTDEPHSTRTTLEQIELIRSLAVEYPEAFLPATRSADVARARREGRVASFVAVENGVGLENSLPLLRSFYALGVRYMTLCHNETLEWVDSATDVRRHGGLTDFGREVVREMNRLGMIVDLSHTTSEVMQQVLDLSVVPVAITHANARTLCNHPRNVTDEVLVRLKEKGSIVMATFVPNFLDQAARDWGRHFENEYGKFQHVEDEEAALREHARKAGPSPVATLGHVCDHLEYLVAKAGVDQVGVGSDFFGGVTPRGLENVSRFPHLFAELLRRGWSETDLTKIASANFLRVFRSVERHGDRCRKAA